MMSAWAPIEAAALRQVGLAAAFPAELLQQRLEHRRRVQADVRRARDDEQRRNTRRQERGDDAWLSGRRRGERLQPRLVPAVERVDDRRGPGRPDGLEDQRGRFVDGKPLVEIRGSCGAAPCSRPARPRWPRAGRAAPPTGTAGCRPPRRAGRGTREARGRRTRSRAACRRGTSPTSEARRRPPARARDVRAAAGRQVEVRRPRSRAAARSASVPCAARIDAASSARRRTGSTTGRSSQTIAVRLGFGRAPSPPATAPCPGRSSTATAPGGSSRCARRSRRSKAADRMCCPVCCCMWSKRRAQSTAPRTRRADVERRARRRGRSSPSS